MKLEIYCESCGNLLLDTDVDTTNPSPVYIPQCNKCSDTRKEPKNESNTTQG